jgi:hypothetical protein
MIILQMNSVPSLLVAESEPALAKWSNSALSIISGIDSSSSAAGTNENEVNNDQMTGNVVT